MLTEITGTAHTLYGRLFMVSPIEPPHTTKLYHNIQQENGDFT